MSSQINILYEDNFLIVLDKPGGILVHETPAHEKNTVVASLIKQGKLEPKLSWPDPSRPGIVHRLDKDTSGLILIAKTPEILDKLQQQFKARKVQKTYTTLVLGEPQANKGKIEAAISRGKAGAQKAQTFPFSSNGKSYREAMTFYQTIAKYKFQNDILTLLEVIPKTGRMHQIRVHLKYLGNPIIGDPLYHTKASHKISKKLGFSRQFLHASKLEFTHPINNEHIRLKSELSIDLKNILSELQESS